MKNFYLLVGNDSTQTILNSTKINNRYPIKDKIFSFYDLDFDMDWTGLENHALFLKHWDIQCLGQTPDQIQYKFWKFAEQWDSYLTQINTDIWIVSFNPVMLNIFNKFRNNVYISKYSGITALYDVADPDWLANFRSLESLYIRNDEIFFSED